jgi:hypothetical protein
MNHTIENPGNRQQQMRQKHEGVKVEIYLCAT